ncbi:5169_t:CDS:2, partial [Ambispora gerdemannii]
RVGNNFRWPSSMPERFRRNAFRKIADVEFEFDDEIGFNFIFFYNALDKGEFAGHENEWVTVHNQKVIEYGQEYRNDKLDYILETMPGAIQLPVDQTRLPRSKPAKMMIGQRTNNGADYKKRSEFASEDLTKWVRAEFLLWEERPGNQVEYALVGNDVTDQLAYAHEPGNPLKVLDIVDEARLTVF